MALKSRPCSIHATAESWPSPLRKRRGGWVLTSRALVLPRHRFKDRRSNFSAICLAEVDVRSAFRAC